MRILLDLEPSEYRNLMALLYDTCVETRNPKLNVEMKTLYAKLGTGVQKYNRIIGDQKCVRYL